VLVSDLDPTAAGVSTDAELAALVLGTVTALEVVVWLAAEEVCLDVVTELAVVVWLAVEED